MRLFMSEAGGRAETSDRKARATTKACRECGCGIDSRKTYCGPCYDVRLATNIAANRHKYRKARL